MPDLLPYPIVIIGAGPIGLAAAVKCAKAGADFLLLEAGPEPAWAVRQWAHVPLFSPWGDCLDADAALLLESAGWKRPGADQHPSGADLIARYLDPLAAHPALRDRIRLGCRVVSIRRRGMEKQVAAGRFDRPFVMSPEAGRPLLARAVIDATGSWFNPRRVPTERCPGRPGRIFDAMPQFDRGRVRARFRGKRVLVVGAGHSGMTTILGLSACLGPGSGTEIAWITRSAVPGSETPHPPGSARAALEARARAAIAAPNLSVISGMSVASLVETAHGVIAFGEDKRGGDMEVRADLAIVSTGYRPDLGLEDELWVRFDHRWECPIGLADLIDPEKHSCNGVPRHGAAELAHPERDFFIAGMKSYGRAPNFALDAGYAQVSSIVERLVRTEPCSSAASASP